MQLYVTRALPIDVAAAAGGDIHITLFPHDRAPTREELLEGARAADGLVTLLSDAVDESLLAQLPRIRVVANVAVGLDNIDRAACARRSVQVTHTPEALTAATADLTWALILAAARRVVEGDKLVRAGRFHGWSPTMLLGKELSAATLGVFGFGRIGQAVARRARGFEMNVLFSNRSPVPEAVARATGAAPVSFDELIARSDVLSVHCPLTPETRHALAGPQLMRMKRGAIVVNTSRGPVIDEAALAAALEAGQLSAAGLDVYEREPEVHPALLGRDDVVLLPHLGSATWETRSRMATMAVVDAARVLRGERPLHPAPPPA
jgi:glyoxylate reductase